MTLQTQRVRTLEQVRAFIEGSEAVDFVGGDHEVVYVLVRRTLETPNVVVSEAATNEDHQTMPWGYVALTRYASQ